MGDLIERLRAMLPVGRETGSSDYALVNPDGPEAADELSSLRERVEALEAVVERAIRQAQNIGIDSGSYYETLLASRPPCQPGER